VPSRGDVVPLPFGRPLSAPRREIAPLQEFDRRFHGEREFAQLGFKPPQSRQNVVTWFDAVVLEKRDPICDTGSDQIGDKRVRIHDLRLYRYITLQRSLAHKTMTSLRRRGQNVAVQGKGAIAAGACC
jgi:hypothetical protein